MTERPRTGIQQVSPRWVLVTLGMIVAYTALNWLLTVKFRLLPVNLADTFIAVAVAIACMSVWIWPAMRLVDPAQASGKRSYPRFDGFAIAVILSSLLLVTAQRLMRLKSAALTRLERVSDLPFRPSSEYYTIGKLWVDQAAVVRSDQEFRSGTAGKFVTRAAHVAIPVHDAADDMPGALTRKPRLMVIDQRVTDTAGAKIRPDSILETYDLPPAAAMALYGQRAHDGATIITTMHGKADPTARKLHDLLPQLWIGLTFETSFPENATDEDKKKAVAMLEQRIRDSVARFDPRAYTYFERVTDRRERGRFHTGGPSPRKQQIVLLPHTGSFEGRAQGTLLFFIILLSLCTLLRLLIAVRASAKIRRQAK